MANTVNIKDEQDTTDLLTYTSIQLESATALDGTYSLIATLTLVAAQVYYTYVDSAGTLGTWYRYRLYNPTGPVASGYSNQFQVTGSTRLLIRQRAIETYRAGAVLHSTSGGSSTSVLSLDLMVKSTAYSLTRGKGSWLYVADGVRAGEVSRITGITPSTGAIAVNPALTGALGDGDAFEWHWMSSVDEWNRAINRAMKRYKYFSRVPVVGVGTPEISLADIPGLYSRSQVLGLWYYPISTGVEKPWGGNGRWWDTRGEDNYLILMSAPPIDTGTTIYLEYLQDMPEVFTDDSVLPSALNLDLAASLAYDEVLAGLLTPAYGASSVDRKAFDTARLKHQDNLAAMFRLYGPRGRWQPRPLAEAVVGPQYWRAR